jgi:hypothetical protein
MKIFTLLKVPFLIPYAVNISITVFAILSLFVCAPISAQIKDKPRLLKYTTPLCPVDINKTFAKEGLLAANKETIAIIPDTTYILINDSNLVNVNNKKVNKPEDVAKLRQIKQDTVLLRTLLIDPGYAFDIIQQIGSYSLIKFWPLRDQKNKGLFQHSLLGRETAAQLDKLSSESENFAVKGLTIVGPDSNGKKGEIPLYDLSKTTFIIPTTLILNNSVEFENKNGQLNIGLLALPVKIRPFATENGQFDFTDGFSVGSTFSWTLHHNFQTGFTHNLLGYMGISSFTADSSKIKEVRNDNDYKIAAFSPAIGYMWGKNNVQLTLLVGIDFPAGKVQQNWVYRNKPWIGLGIGIGMFKIGNEDNNKQGKNN